MNAVVHTINAAGQAFVGFALPMLIQSAVLILILLFVDFLLRRRVRAVFRYWIWMLVLLKLLLPPSLCSPISFGTWFGDTLEAPTAVFQESPAPREPDLTNGWQPQAQLEDGALPESPIVQSFAPKAAPPITLVQAQRVEVPPEPSPQTPQIPGTAEVGVVPATPIPPGPTLNWQALVLLAWMATALALLLLLLQRAWFVRGLVAQAQEAPATLMTALDECRVRMGRVRAVALRVSPNAASPAVCGLWRPVILIPKNLAPKLRPRDMQAVLLHELAHVKRGDLWVNLIQTLLQIVYFYNPLLWLANVMIRRVREQAVDEAVLVAMGETARDYPETLISVAKLAFRKRPALSLRLIGVVESKSALSGRIKHILTRPLPQTARLGLLGLATVFIIAAFLLPMAGATLPEPSVENAGPLDIRFVGVCPDQSDDILDSDGNKIDTMPYAMPKPGAWKADTLRRDFIFELPQDIEGPLVLCNRRVVRAAGRNERLDSSYIGPLFPVNVRGRRLVFVDTFLPRTYRQPVLGLVPRRTPVDRVDVAFRYFHGPAPETVMRFDGPFAEGQVVVSAEDPQTSLTVLPEQQQGPPTERKAQFRLSVPFEMESDTPILIYDTAGRRHLCWKSSVLHGRHQTTVDLHTFLESVPLSRVARVAVEKPYEVTVRNVRVAYPNRPARDHAADLDAMAQKLELTGMTPEQLARYQFKSPQEVIAVIDALRSHDSMRLAVDALGFSNPRFHIADLDRPTQEVIRRTARRWADAGYMSHLGIQLGLMGGWPEFFEMATERLSSPSASIINHLSYERAMLEADHWIAHIMANYTRRLTPAQAQQVQRTIRATDRGSVLYYLLHCLAMTRSAATTDIFWELGQDERPWIWWPALERWDARVRETDQPSSESLPASLALRLALVQNRLDNEELRADATALLSQMLTPELERMESRTWQTAFERIARNVDRVTATTIFIDYLRQVRSAMASRPWEIDDIFRNGCSSSAARIIRTLNVWYARDFGGLGTDATEESTETLHRITASAQLEPLLTEVLAWYDGQRELKPIELPFTGQVTDTAGRPIAGARLSLTNPEDNANNRGTRAQRHIAMAESHTDAEGRFTFAAPTGSTFYRLDVTADGYIPRDRVSVLRRADGRFVLVEKTESTTIVMEKPSRVFGTLIGPDGEPLGHARLRVASHPVYSVGHGDLHPVDDQGHFTIDPIRSGDHLLAYGPRRRPSPTGDYEGITGYCLVQIQEGDTMDDVVVDLRTSTATLEVEVTDRAGHPVAVDGLSLAVAMPSDKERHEQIMFATDVTPQRVHRFPNLPPGPIVVRTYVRPQGFQGVAVELRPNETTRCRIELDVGAGGGARVEPPQRDVNATAATSTVAKLPNGVTVELVGVCEHPSAGKQWWRADGSVLEQAPCEYSGVLFVPPGASGAAYEFVTRLAHLPEDASVTLKTEPGGMGRPEARPDGLHRVTVTLPGDLEECQLLCDVAAGPWEAAASSNGTLFSPLAVRSEPIVFTEGLGRNDGGVTITASDDILEHPHRIVAITKNGDIVHSSQEIRIPSSKVREATAYFKDIPRDQIAEFQLQIRPWTRARFDNVSLRPGQKTPVAVGIEPPKAAVESNGNEAKESVPLPLMARAEKVMPVAEQEARRLNHAYVGTEHILLALARQETAVSARVLNKLGVDIDTLRAEVNKLVRPGPEPVTQRTLPRTSRAERIMQYAREEAKALNHEYLGTEHILLALTEERNSIAAQVLANLNLTPLRIRTEVLNFVRPGAQDSAAGGNREGRPDGSEVVLPAGDKEPVILDLATGRLVPMPLQPAKTSFSEFWQSIKELGQGDLLYDCDDGDHLLILTRDATSEQAEQVSSESPRIQAHLIGPDLPEVLTVTTTEGRHYRITVLAASDEDCTLNYVQLSSDEDAGEVPTTAPVGPGPLGRNALYFDGVDDCLIVPASPSLKLQAPLFLEVWVDPDPADLPEDDPRDQPRRLMSLIRCGTEQRDVQRPSLDDSTVIEADKTETDEWPPEFLPRDQLGLYTHQSNGFVVFTHGHGGGLFTAQDDGRLTQRGVLIARSVSAERPQWQYTYACFHDAQVFSSGPNDALVIGGSLLPVGLPFEGQIAEIRIWNKIPVGQASGQYETTSLAGNEPNLVACWTFDEGAGQIVHDISRNGNHAYLGTGPTAEASDPTWVDPLDPPAPERAVAASLPAREDTVVLPDVTRGAMMLDLASGQLVALPRGGSFIEVGAAVETPGQGDLVYGYQRQGFLALMRGATSEQATGRIGNGLLEIPAYSLSAHLPSVLTITTAEGHRYEITILAADEAGCTLKYTLLSEEDAGDTVVAELPNGVTVELLAYSQLTRGGLQWWTPKDKQTTIPDVYEADVEGLGTVLAFRVEPPEAYLRAEMFRGPDAQDIKNPWRLAEHNLWLLPLGEERRFANLRLSTRLTLPPVMETIALTEENVGQLVEVNRCGIASIVDLHVLDENMSGMMMEEIARQMGLPSEYGADGEMAKSMGLRDMVDAPTLQFSTINAADSSQSIVALLDKEGHTYPVARLKYTSAGAVYVGQLWPDQLAGLVVEASAVHTADVQFRNVSLTPHHVTEIQIEPAAERQLSWKRSYAWMLREILTNSIASYRKTHGGRFPSALEALEANHDEDSFRWLLANITYVGKGKSFDDDPPSMIAYDKTLLAEGQGTYVFYSDGRFEFESPLELEELGGRWSPSVNYSDGQFKFESPSEGQERDVLESVEADEPDAAAQVSTSLSDAKSPVTAIEAMLDQWVADAEAGRLDAMKRAYGLNASRDHSDMEDMQELLSINPDWEFSLLSVAWTDEAALAVSGKLNAGDPKAEPEPVVLVWNLSKLDQHWGITDIDLEQIEGLQRENSYFLQHHPGAQVWYVEPGLSVSEVSGSAVEPSPVGRYALALDGIDDCLIVPPGLSLRAPFSIEVWLKPDALVKNWPPMTLMQKGRKPVDPCDLQAGGFFLWGGPTASPEARAAMSLCLAQAEGKLFQVGMDSGPSLDESAWFHLCEQYAGDKYVPVPDQPLLIGNDFLPNSLKLKGQFTPFKGQIAEIRIWSRSLTDEERRYYADVSLTGNEPGLLACWTFEEGAGQIVRDISPNGNHAYLGKSKDAEGSDPKWVDLMEGPERVAGQAASEPSEPDAPRKARFTVLGTVTDDSGQPMEGVWVNVDCGFEKPQRADRALTDAQGRYALHFKSAWTVADADPYGVGIQPALVYAEKDGFYEMSLGHKGNLALAGERPGPDEQRFVADRAGVVLANEPYELNFTMTPAARIEGRILDETGTPIPRPEVWLRHDKTLSKYSMQGVTRGNGWFTLESIPCGSARLMSVREQQMHSEIVTLAEPGTYRITLQYGQSPSGRPNWRITNLETPPGDQSGPAFDRPRVVDPNGAPVAGAQVALGTKDRSVLVRDGILEQRGASAMEKGQVVETDAQGYFDLDMEPGAAFEVVAAHETGFAVVSAEQFQSTHTITLQPWGRIEGKVAEGREPLEGKIWMASLPNSTWLEFKREYRYETLCDDENRFTFARVPAGRFEVGYLTNTSRSSASVTSRTPVEVLPGRTAYLTVGGEGRPVVGRFVPPSGYDGPLYFGAGLRSLMTARPEEPQPGNYDRMTRREQQAWHQQWRQTPEAKAFYDAIWRNPNWRQYTFRIEDDGTFRIEDVIPGTYDLTVWLEERFTGQGRPEEIGGYSGAVEVPEMAEAYSDEPIDLGDLVLTMRTPLHVGDMAPLFEAKTLEDDDIRLADYRGRFVLLSFWSPVFDPELDRLKELHADYGGTDRLQIIGLGGTDTFEEIKNYVAERNVAWPQIYFGRDWDATLLRQLGGQMQILLIDPEGKIVSTWLRGEELTTAVRNALAETN